jgi:hypothetical protein
MEKERRKTNMPKPNVLNTPHIVERQKYDGNRSLPMDFVTSCRDEEVSIRRAMYDKDILAGAGSAQSQL